MTTTETFDSICKEYVADQLRRYPEFATGLGVHDFDHEVTDHSPAAHDDALRVCRRFVMRLQQIDDSELSAADRLDHGLLLSSLRGELVSEERMRMASRTPDGILEGFCYGVLLLIRRNFAPIEERMESAIARLEKFPSVASAARARLTEPSTIPLDIAIASMGDTASFFESTLPATFDAVSDPSLRARLGAAIHTVTDDYDKLRAWLEERRGVAMDAFAIGAETYEASLREAELVSMPLNNVWNRAKSELERLCEDFAETAQRVDPTKSPAEVFEQAAADHPPADQLIPFTEAMLEDLRSFIVERGLLTYPNENRCVVTPTPEFARELTFASAETPGPFEKASAEAFYNVTTALPEWDAEKTEQHMRAYNRYSLTSTSIHEAYPGHYTQFLWQDLWPSDIRKMAGSYSAVEGWAHYVEQLMVDEGYMDGDPLFRLGYLQEALLRACRMVAAIGMHAGEMSVSEAVDLFKTKGYIESANAEREVRRGTTDPMYCNYTLGKLMMLKLRDDYMRAKPETSLKKFHDAFLAEGCAPIPLVRAKLLGSTGAPL